MSLRSSTHIYGGRSSGNGGKDEGIDVLIETQGSAGIENRLSKADIDNAVCVVLSNDVAIREEERFKGKKIIRMGVSDLIKKAKPLVKKIKKTFE